MPVETTENYVRVRRRDPGGFTEGTMRTVVIDRSKGIKAVMGKLKGESTMTIQTLLFPVDTFTEGEAKKWVEEHNLEHIYVKQLLYQGKFPHPQNPSAVVNLNEKVLHNIADNSIKFLDAGGKIPVTSPPHPATSKEKIEKTIGQLTDVFQSTSQDVYGVVALYPEANEWVAANKVDTVSAGVVADVRTAHGDFDNLLDHVCITPDPYLLKQDGFTPMTAEQYSYATAFFDTNSVVYPHTSGTNTTDYQEDGGSMDEIKKLLAKILGKVEGIVQHPPSKQVPVNEAGKGEGGSNMTIEELQVAYTKLESELKTANDNVATLTKKLDEYHVAEDKTRLEAFTNRIEACIKSGRMLPEKRDALVARFNAFKEKGIKELMFGDTKESIADILLASFEALPLNTTIETKLSKVMRKIRVDKEVFDLETLDGRNAFSDHVAKFAREKNISYEDARQKVLNDATTEGGS